MSYSNTKDGYIRYSLVSNSRKKTLIEDPEGWDESKRQFAANKDFKGVFVKVSNDLGFYGNAASFLTDIAENTGFEDVVKLVREEKNPLSIYEDWETVETGNLELKEINIEDETDKVLCPFGEDNFWITINNAKSNNIDIATTTANDGTVLDELKTYDLLIEEGRKIFLRSVLEVDPEKELLFNNSNGNEFENEVIPLIVKVNSDQNNISGVFRTEMNEDVIGLEKTYGNGLLGNMFYDISDRKRTITLNGQINADFFDSAVSFTNVTIDLVKYTYDFNNKTYPLVSVVKLSEDTDPDNSTVLSYTFSDYVINMEENESLALAMTVNAEGLVKCTFPDTSLVVTEDSEFPSTEHKVVKPFDLFDRIVTILTGRKNAFRSDLFSSGGELENLVTIPGYWVRGSKVDVENSIKNPEERSKVLARFLQFKTSFKEAFEDYNSVMPLGVFLEYEGGLPYLRIEKLQYLYQKDVGVKVGKTVGDNFEFYKISELKRSVDSDLLISTIEVGSEKGGTDYEEAQGLDEFNGKSTFNTFINSSDTVYKIVSKARKDSYGFEFARRVPFRLFPDKDTRYDEDIFMLSCKQVNGVLTLKRWSDDYEVIPTGVYSPETAFNLDITPARCLLNHSFYINSGLYLKPDEIIRFRSSNSNSSLTTKKAGEQLISENGEIPHSILDRPLFSPWKWEFETPMDYQLLKALEGESNQIPNVYKRIQISTRRGTEYAYLKKVEKGNSAKWELKESVN